MAKKTLKIDDLNDDQQYSVTLTRPIPIGRSWARPGAGVTLKGKVIKENADGIDTVQPIAD